MLDFHGRTDKQRKRHLALYAFLNLCMDLHCVDFLYLCVDDRNVWMCIFIMYGHLWSCVVMYGHVWSCTVMYGHGWSWLVMYGHIWSSMVKYEYIWSNMVSCQVKS